MQHNNSTEQHGLSPEMRSELADIRPGSIHWDVSMAEYCTFRTGGNVEALVTVSNREQLVALMQWLNRNEVRWRVIGRGSNILVQSSGFQGVVIVLGDEFTSIEPLTPLEKSGKVVKLRVGAGCSVSKLVGWCCEHGISGTEFLVGIPGSIGGAVYMNAGAWGSEIGDRIDSVSFVDQEGKILSFSRSELDFSYRDMGFRKESSKKAVVVETILSLELGNEKEIMARCREHQQARRVKQPLGVASAGSFFRNPPGDSAGRLIDAAGLKGLRCGDAMVSVKHANFIVNTGQATPDDIIELMQEVQEKVYLHSGVRLELEVQLL